MSDFIVPINVCGEININISYVLFGVEKSVCAQKIYTAYSDGRLMSQDGSMYSTVCPIIAYYALSNKRALDSHYSGNFCMSSLRVNS